MESIKTWKLYKTLAEEKADLIKSIYTMNKAESDMMNFIRICKKSAIILGEDWTNESFKDLVAHEKPLYRVGVEVSHYPEYVRMLEKRITITTGGGENWSPERLVDLDTHMTHFRPALRDVSRALVEANIELAMNAPMVHEFFDLGQMIV